MAAPRRRVARVGYQGDVERRRSVGAADRFPEAADAAARFGARWRFTGSSYNDALDRVLYSNVTGGVYCRASPSGRPYWRLK